MLSCLLIGSVADKKNNYDDYTNCAYNGSDSSCQIDVLQLFYRESGTIGTELRSPHLAI